MIDSILAGVLITIGCNVYLSCENKYIGALLFTVGLITILLFGFNLYTGKVCYLPCKTIKISNVFTIILGNFIGCGITGILLHSETARTMWDAKMETPLFNVFIKAILCNILIYIAVESYKTHKTLIPTFVCIPTFILSGYEHSIADFGYCFMAGRINAKSLLFLLIVVIGNAIGGMLIPLCNILKKERKSK